MIADIIIDMKRDKVILYQLYLLFISILKWKLISYMIKNNLY